MNKDENWFGGSFTNAAIFKTKKFLGGKKSRDRYLMFTNGHIT
jgi:hypothetical protein